MDQNKLRFFFTQLQSNQLPGFDAHVELTPYRKNIQVPDVKPDARSGAVAVIIAYNQPTPILILTKRASYQGVHGGQISFPGGKVEEKDSDLIHTAKRETSEETGILLSDSNYLMPLSNIYIPPSNFLVHPFLFLIDHDFTVEKNDEVEYLIEMPLSFLNNQNALTQKDIVLYNGTTIKNAPCFVYENEIIWGATAAILNELRWLINKNLV